MVRKMEKVVGYVRVSTLTQAEGHSLEFQEEAIKKYCQLHNLKLVKLYRDEGVSALAKRPNFQKAFKRVLEDDEIKGIVVYDLTRFGRSTVELLTNIEMLKAKGKFLASIKENIDLSTKTGKLLFTVLAAIAEFERETIRERLRAGKEWAKIHGTKSGKPMHRPKKPIDWQKVKELRRYGLSWTKIAKHVGVSPPTLISRAKEEGIYYYK